MPAPTPPSRARRAPTQLRPTVFYVPTPRAAHDGAPPCVPDDADGCHDCGRDDEPRASAFWRLLRLVLEPTALR